MTRNAAEDQQNQSLQRLLPHTHARLVAGPSGNEVELRGITEDSRRVQHGSLFVAVPGRYVDGTRFVAQACAAGARAVVAERAIALPPNVAMLVAEDARAALAELAAAWHAYPARSLRLVGVTGTNGKTTSAFLTHALLTRLGERCGRLGTVDIDLGDGAQPSAAAYTTPPAEELHASLASMRDNGCRFAAMEVSSQALDQRRVHGVTFAAALFTNLTQDHLDYHETFDAYATAKARLFEQIDTDGIALLNGDDDHVGLMLASCKAHTLTFGLGRHNVYRATAVLCSAAGSRFQVLYPGARVAIETPLTGEFNVRNVLGTFAMAHALGYEAGAIAQALRDVTGAPGRLEPIKVAEISEPPVRVYVDYAHTPDALDKALRALRGANIDTTITVVFGCGGDRDRSKRSRMGTIASRLADRIVLTSDNPRNEDPDSILDQIASGIPSEALGRTSAFVDRAMAIEHAITHAEPGTIVLIAGKGHETYQIIGSSSQAFDDREVAREVLRSRLVTRGALRRAG